MSHDHLPPSPFGAGTQYDAAGEHIVPPVAEAERSANLPRISRIIGEKAAERAVQMPPRIWRKEEAETPLTYTAASDVRPGNSYDGPASRHIDLDRAEAVNIQAAAKREGVPVDYWKANRNLYRK